MSLRLDGASYIRNATAPLTTIPFVMGMWVNPAVSGVDHTMWSMSDTGSATQYYRTGLLSTNDWVLVVQAGGLPAIATVATVTGFSNQWNFVLAQVASDDDLVLHVIAFDGTISGSHLSTTVGPPTGVDSMQIGALLTSGGASELFTGRIAEYWIANVDPGVISNTENDDFVYQLGWYGPFAMPQIASNIIEYRSLRKFPTSLADNLTEVYWGGGKGIQTWSGVGSPTTGAHPPLPYGFVKPGQYKKNLIV